MTKGNDFVTCIPGSQWNKPEYGLTKRELFAAMAMQGILSGLGWDSLIYNESVAKDAAMLADKLITALNEKQDGE